MGGLNNGKIIKWLGLDPLKKPEIKIELVPEVHQPKQIVYGTGDLEVMKTRQVGTHIKTVNTLSI